MKKSLNELPNGILQEIVFVNKCKHLLVRIIENGKIKAGCSFSHYIIFDVKTGEIAFELKNNIDLDKFKILAVLIKPEEPYIFKKENI